MYTQTFYPQFSDIRIYNVPGRDPLEIQEKIVEFFTDPNHQDYRLIHVSVNYLSWNDESLSAIPRDLWTSVAIIYTT